MKKFILAFLVLAISPSASAFSGSDLLSQCRKFVEIIEGGKTDLHHSFDAGLCGGYVLGVQEGFIASSELSFIASQDQGIKPVAGVYWDVPDDVEAEKIVKIVVRYLEINPDMLDRLAVLSVINALMQTYPAKKSD